MDEEFTEGYVLLVDRFMQIKSVGKVVVSKERFVKGDVVYLNDEDATRLLATGSIVAVGDPEPDLEPVPDEDTDEDGTPDGDADDHEGQEEAPEDQEEPVYAGMAYSDLQLLAKERTGNGGGNKAELIERLIAHARA